MKTRKGPDGFHIFDRASGLNILLDELQFSSMEWSGAPRQISIALTNACDLTCEYCYAPKQRAKLTFKQIDKWLEELDSEGCLGIGFGGGEPTLHPEFVEICENVASRTKLAVTVTTHGNRLTEQLLSRLAGTVNFFRISLDGVGSTYETQRGRSFDALVENIERTRKIASIGLNVVVNEKTVLELDDISIIANQVGASELLLLPQQPTKKIQGASEDVQLALSDWVKAYRGGIRLAVSEAGSEGLPICEPLPLEKGLQAYAHIDASGMLKENSFTHSGVAIGADGVLAALATLQSYKGSR